jgi:cyclopropane fatty-acyl-phospholipid synthase-like methyltransferase
MDVSANWYEGFFENDWLEQIALGIPAEQTAEQADFLVEKLGLAEGDRVLDLACGHGRIALELARRGYRVTGLDLSPRSLRFARESAERAGLEIDWIEADMREIPTGAEFDAIVNVFTAFGYFEDEGENQRVLDGVAGALAPGGGFLIDVINLLGLVRRYRDRLWEERDGVFQLDEHEFDFLRGRNAASWTFVYPDGRRTELRHSVRTYTPHELASMLEAAGLTVEEAWGGWDAAELSFDSRRLILLARKSQA